ncbi:MAG: hypothetical protein ACTHM2_10395 [Afipia sp.]|jgi:hypothetical protein
MVLPPGHDDGRAVRQFETEKPGLSLGLCVFVDGCIVFAQDAVGRQVTLVGSVSENLFWNY